MKCSSSPTMAPYTGSVIDIDLVIASDDENAINVAIDRLDG